MSYRTQIAAALKSRLLSQTPAGANVFTSLDRPLTPEDLPAIVIYTMSARRGSESYGDALIPRVVTVNIEAAIQSTPATALADAEQLADAIETVIEADPTLAHVVNDCVWQQTLTDVSAHGSVTLGVVLLEYEVTMFTNAVSPGAFEPTDDGFTGVPTIVHSSPDVTAPGFPDAIRGDFDTACGPDGCDLPAWGGEVPRP